MKKLVSLTLLGALTLAACGGGGSALAATVDGQEVTTGDVEALIDSAGAAVAKDEFARFLAFQIQWLVVFGAAQEDYGLTYTAEEVSTEAERLIGEVAAEDETREDFLSSRGITEEFLQRIARQQLIDRDLREIFRDDIGEPTAEQIEGQLNTAKAPLTEVCASHILVATEDEANDALTRVEDGEEFSEVATQLSTDGSATNGGDLGCTTADQYVESFRDAVLVAPVGEVYPEVVESEFGFHVILVTERTDADPAGLPTNEELAEMARDQLVTDVLEEWFLDSVAEADIEVVEEFGTWSDQPPTVVPPTEE